MVRQPEGLLAKSIKHAIRETWGHSCVIKINPSAFMAKGCPDLLGCVEGRMIALEVKMPGKENTLRPEQEQWLTAFRMGGAISGMVTSVEGALALIEENL